MNRTIVHNDQEVIDFVNKHAFWFQDYVTRLPRSYPCWCLVLEKEGGVLPYAYIEFITIADCEKLLGEAFKVENVQTV